MNPFAEQYKLINNVDLIRILEKPEEYQPIALEAAQSELAYRKLSSEELVAARAEIELQKEIEKVRKQREIGAIIKTKASPLLEYFTSVQIYLKRFINFAILAQWLIGIGAFISLVAYGIVVGFPMYFIGVILYWTTNEHNIDKITWTVLPVIAFVVLFLIIYT